AVFTAIHYLAYQRGRKIHVFLPYAQSLYGVADWFRQLWAESLGKKLDRAGRTVEVGPTPVKALGATDQHSQIQLYLEGPQDKLVTFMFLQNEKTVLKIPKDAPAPLGGHTLGNVLKAEGLATRAALTEYGRPNLSFWFPEVSAYTLGQIFFLLEMSTALMGELFDINAFDQPAVELGKKLTKSLLSGQPADQRLFKDNPSHYV
ncbi:MAG TPA: glucose-6-phosphate isomerase, partial [Elusimicrobiota bacterium]|nr:glucose-6-phosphate isomerase [Elusimicrobiota bacterium]